MYCIEKQITAMEDNSLIYPSFHIIASYTVDFINDESVVTMMCFSSKSGYRDGEDFLTRITYSINDCPSRNSDPRRWLCEYLVKSENSLFKDGSIRLVRDELYEERLFSIENKKYGF